MNRLVFLMKIKIMTFSVNLIAQIKRETPLLSEVRSQGGPTSISDWKTFTSARFSQQSEDAVSSWAVVKQNRVVKNYGLSKASFRHKTKF